MFTKLLLSTVRFRYMVDGWLYRRRPATAAAMATLRARVAGGPMIILGNGPSVNQTPLDDFAAVPAIGLNKINLLFDRVKWRPSLICCVNNLVVKQNAEYFRTTELPVFLSWKCRWFLGGRPGPNVHYLKPRGTIEFSRDPLDWIAGQGGTVTYLAMQMAYALGANPVILFGVDHSFKAEGPKQAIRKMEGPDPNHFDPNYFAKGTHWGLPNLELSELAYRAAKHAFETDGRRIVDATIGGKLEVYPKISVAEAKRLCEVG